MTVKFDFVARNECVVYGGLASQFQSGMKASCGLLEALDI